MDLPGGVAAAMEVVELSDDKIASSPIHLSPKKRDDPCIAWAVFLPVSEIDKGIAICSCSREEFMPSRGDETVGNDSVGDSLSQRKLA